MRGGESGDGSGGAPPARADGVLRAPRRAAGSQFIGLHQFLTKYNGIFDSSCRTEQGKLTINELKGILQREGIHIEDTAFYAMCESFDPDRDGRFANPEVRRTRPRARARAPRGALTRTRGALTGRLCARAAPRSGGDSLWCSWPTSRAARPPSPPSTRSGPGPSP